MFRDIMANQLFAGFDSTNRNVYSRPFKIGITFDLYRLIDLNLIEDRPIPSKVIDELNLRDRFPVGIQREIVQFGPSNFGARFAEAVIAPKK